MKEVKRPPLGLVPRDIWFYNVLKERIKEIMEALNRYMEAKKKVPVEWIEEYNNTLSQFRYTDLENDTHFTKVGHTDAFKIMKWDLAGYNFT